MENAINIAYLAGLFDGEGCVVYKQYRVKKGSLKWHINLEIAMTEIEPLHWFYNIVKVGTIHYKKNQGYKTWHYENDGFQNRQKRVLVFMTYLNNVEDGGTEFHFQNTTTPAKKGLTLIWPAYFTHTHRGQISKTKEKYIITGWYSNEN